MTTLTTAESSTELSEHSLGSVLRLVALYGVGPLIAVILTLWLTKSVSAKQDEQIAASRATQAVIERHVHTTNDQLEHIGRQLEVNCRVSALLAKNTAIGALCEVGR
jgi:hypothetical protein